jgi:outer membrane lipoprotein-sorting protein
MSRIRDLTTTGSMNSTISLTITEKGGSVRNRTISMLSKSYPGGTEKRLIRFTEPADIRGTSMLVIDNKDIADEMWIYLPALKKTRRIVSSEKGKSFMSSEFSNSDMSSPTLSDFNNNHLTAPGENNLWIIESIPVSKDKADEYGYSKKITYVNSTNYQVEKIEYYNFDNKLFKTMEVKNIQPSENGKYIIKDMVATNIMTGRSSRILFNKIATGVNIPDSEFSLQNLER